MAKKRKLHEIRDIFTNRNLLEGAQVKELEDGTVLIKGITIIKAGLSKNRNFYPPAVLQKAAPLFANLQIRTDHPVEGKDPSVRDVVGKIEETWFDTRTQSMKGNAKFSSTEGKLITKIEEGLIGDVSINARGETGIERGSKGVQRRVKEITKAWSVDLVSYASAGGTLSNELHESFRRTQETCERMVEQMDELENVKLEELTKARPDLVEQIMKQVKDELKEKKTSDSPDAVTSGEVKDIVNKSITETLGSVFKERDKKQEEKEATVALAEAIETAVDETLTESDVKESVKNFISKGLLSFAQKNFESIDKIDKKVLSEKRDEFFDDFAKIVEDFKKPSSKKKSGDDGKSKREADDKPLMAYMSDAYR